MSQRSRSNRTLSQRSEAASSSQAEVNTDVVNKCVRFLLTRMNTNIPIKKTDIVKHAFPKGSHKTYEAIISKTKSILDDVYGLHLEVIDCDSAKRYIVSNALPVLTNLNVEEDQSLKSVVMLLVLAHIYMSRNSATDLSLWKFLNEFKFMRDSEIEEGLTVKQFVTKTLVKQQYICMENRGGEHEDGQLKMKFTWGPHAEYSISKLSLLQFVANIYDTEVEYWKDLYQDARQQENSSEPIVL